MSFSTLQYTSLAKIMKTSILTFLFLSLTSAHILPNANHIFNTIHSATRQWGSSLNHNGMTLFLASVPADVRLYHGDSSSTPISGMQWLSFEPEHSALFAKTEGMESWASSPSSFPVGAEMRQSTFQADSGMFSAREGTSKVRRSEKEPERTSPRYFHTYHTTRPLRLLYIDGMSAAKSSIGTLDLQDLIILGRTPDAPPLSDLERLRQICARIKEFYNNKLDGILRMEGGLEVMLCESQDVLLCTDILAMKPAQGPAGGMNVNTDDGGFSYFTAVASRYHRLGGERVKVGFDDMVSGFAYTPQMAMDDEDLPRIQDLTEEARSAMRQDVDNMILEHKDSSREGKSWQAVTDMIVSRYATPLKLLRRIEDSMIFRKRLRILLEHFIAYQDSPPTLDVERCASEYLPSRTSTDESNAGQAILSVSKTICQSLAEAFQQDDIEDAQSRIGALMENLGWTTWRYCEGCAEGEICWIPIFPLGTLEDRRKPRCLSESPPMFDGSYWWAT